ncbi:MAG: globin family protein [Limisphaerales bacterium]
MSSLLTSREIELVQKSWSQVLPIVDTAAGLFYGRLFELDPALRPLFKTDITEQGRKLMKMINVAVGGLDNLGALVPAVQDMGRRHTGYGVRDKDYETVGAALLWTLEKGLGPAFTPDVKAAWTKVYTILATTMQAAGGQAPAP